jgi:HSP20 family protein
MVWDIFDEIRRMQEEMDRIFNDFFTGPRYRQIGPGGRPPEAGSESRTPAMRRAFTDLQETDTDIIVTAELPGMSKDDIELTVTADRIDIKAQKKEEIKEEKEGQRYYQSRYAGFSRSVPLPAGVNPDDVKATYKNGVLEIILPKKEGSKSQSVKIE